MLSSLWLPRWWLPLVFQWSPLSPNPSCFRAASGVAKIDGAALGEGKTSWHTLRSESLSPTVQLKSGAWLSLDSSRSGRWRLRPPCFLHEAAVATRDRAPQVTSIKSRDALRIGTVAGPLSALGREGHQGARWLSHRAVCLSPQHGAQAPQPRRNTLKATLLLFADFPLMPPSPEQGLRLAPCTRPRPDPYDPVCSWPWVPCSVPSRSGPSRSGAWEAPATISCHRISWHR